jgi:ABC-type tungstate transport system substrate-binding protein
MNDRFEPRIRISLGSSIAIGPGKAALLQAISETGSIAAAGRQMGMSYRRAWLLAKTMNACFRFPGRDAVVVVVNALMGLPPVVAGLFVYLLLSRSGPLGNDEPLAWYVANILLGS